MVHIIELRVYQFFFQSLVLYLAWEDICCISTGKVLSQSMNWQWRNIYKTHQEKSEWTTRTSIPKRVWQHVALMLTLGTQRQVYPSVLGQPGLQGCSTWSMRTQRMPIPPEYTCTAFTNNANKIKTTSRFYLTQLEQIRSIKQGNLMLGKMWAQRNTSCWGESKLIQPL